MREVKVQGIVFKVHGLTKKKFADYDLSSYGFNFYGGVDLPKDEKVAGEAIEVFIRASLDTDQHEMLEHVTPSGMNKLFLSAIKETYGAEDEEKNLSMSGSGSQETQTKSDTATPAEQ